MFVRHVLVPVDFSERSPAAFSYALGLARATGAQLTLLHVVPGPSRLRLRAAAALQHELPRPSETALLDAREKLSALIDGFDHTGAIVRPRVEVGDPAATIVTLAVENRHDLIVLAIHDRGPLAQQLLGSVSAQVVPLAPCPILLLKAPRP